MREAQSRLESALEVTLGTCSGIFVALAVWTWVIRPIWDIDVTFLDNLWITLIFTVVSVARSYIWRRFFEAGLHRFVHKWVAKLAGKLHKGGL